MYRVKEIFRTIQGEGMNAGRPAVFCRFSGCNFWSGKEEDRDKGPQTCSRWCDTDFVGGEEYTQYQLSAAIKELMPPGHHLVVLTGGEPLIQFDKRLGEEFRHSGFEVAIETNGSIEPKTWLYDWLCVSPKTASPLNISGGDELKIIYPQQMQWRILESLRFKHFLIQPMDGPFLKENTESAIKFCYNHPKWRLSLQTHKFMGIR